MNALRNAMACLLAAGISLSLAVAADAKQKQNKGKPPTAQTAARASAPAPKASAPARPSSKTVLTEGQKYCRNRHRCSMDGKPCKQCAAK